jgi:hypothetical protein
MADDKKEPWLNYLALTTVIFAVCATLSTLKGGGFSTRAVMSQSQASDQWSYFQAKSIKGYLYELQKEKLELDLRNLKGGPRGEYEKKIDGYAQKIKKYDEEKKEIMSKAGELEKTRDRSQKHSGAFGMAAMFLFIAGFTIVFVALGTIFSGAGGLLSSDPRMVRWIAGLVIWILARRGSPIVSGIAKFIPAMRGYVPARALLEQAVLRPRRG